MGPERPVAGGVSEGACDDGCEARPGAEPGGRLPHPARGRDGFRAETSATGLQGGEPDGEQRAEGGHPGSGLSACYYQQVEGDSGSGATLGDFNGRTIGAGPLVSYTKKIGGHDTVFEFKWLHEFETKNRLEGDILWLRAVFTF